MPCNLLFLFYILSTGLEENHRIYYGWAISCILYLAPLMKDLKKNFVVGKILDSTFFSLTRVFPFLVVISLNYMIFAIIGTYFLGGRINSDTPYRYLDVTGADLNANYQNLTWNDLPDSLVFLYCINLNNQMVTLMNMCSFYENSEEKDYAGLLFLAFVIMNNIILFNIFVGLVVGIGMEYSKEIFEND